MRPYKEMAAGRAMLDEVHASLPSSSCDSNTYTLSRIGPHIIAIVCLPARQYGTNEASHCGRYRRFSALGSSCGEHRRLAVWLGRHAAGRCCRQRSGDTI